MKDLFKTAILKGVVAAALPMAKFSANSTCSSCVYQEKLPDSVRKLRKF